MRHTLTALLSAASIAAVAWAAPAAAQVYGAAPAPMYGYGYGPGAWPYGINSTYAGASPTIPSHTGTPAYSYHFTGPYPSPNGECQIIAGNRVCNAAPAYGYGYSSGYGAPGYGSPGGLIGEAVAAPFAAAGALAAAPFEAAGALAGAPYASAYGAYAPGYAPYPMRRYPARGPYKGNSVVPTPLAYSLPPSAQTARPGVVGSCSIIAGNRVCSAAPAIP